MQNQSFFGTLALSLGVLAGLTGCGDDGSGGSVPPPVVDDGGSIPPALKADLQAILDTAVANETTPGAVVHISAGKGATWSAAAGLGDRDANVAMDPDERFRGGSMLKTFVATAVLQAVEAGTLELTDALVDRLPPSVTERIANAESIQIGMLLAHRSGVAEWVNAEVRQVVVTDPAHVWSLDEILDQVETQPAAFQPGEKYGYSNTNYILLGEILSGVSGRTWRDVIRDQVIARSELDHTTLPDPGDLTCPAPCAHGYVAVSGELLDLTHVDPSMAGASGGHALITTPADLTRFFQELRSGALFEQESTLEAMFAFQPAIDPESRLIGYGFGVMQMESQGNIAIGHLGSTAGYQGYNLYVPATDRYVSGYINVMGDIGAVLEPILARVATP